MSTPSPVISASELPILFRELTRRDQLAEIESVLKVDLNGDGGTAAAVAAATKYKACILRLAPDDSPQREEAEKIDPTSPVKDNAELRLRGLLIALAEDLGARRIAPKEPAKKMVNTAKPSTDKQLHQKRLDDRYALLRSIYDGVGGSLRAACDYRDRAKQLGIEHPTDRFTELYEAGLVKFMGPRKAMLTLEGQREVEQTKEDADGGEVFSALTVNNYNTTNNTMTIHANSGSSVVHQQGDHNTATVAVGIRDDVARALQQLRAGFATLPEAEREEAFELVKAIEIEATAPAPKTTVLKSHLRLLNTDYVSLAADAAQLGSVLATAASLLGVSL